MIRILEKSYMEWHASIQNASMWKQISLNEILGKELMAEEALQLLKKKNPQILAELFQLAAFAIEGRLFILGFAVVALIGGESRSRWSVDRILVIQSTATIEPELPARGANLRRGVAYRRTHLCSFKIESGNLPIELACGRDSPLLLLLLLSRWVKWMN